ncbi:MAG: pyridoxal-phosphate dependent enzyme [Deltaproteobacteria bacterium]|nr:MAG: pyridoxal-phosphate dependent enzyme [Deltaproteobacteria bacterium]
MTNTKFTLGLDDFRQVRARIAPHIKHTPLLTSRQLSERSGYDVRLKAEMFQRVGSYKIRGPLNKFALMPDDHAQGVALAARIHGVRAVVCMAANATPSKIAATRGYGAEVVLHGTIWDEANEKAKELVRTEGLTYVHPFDDEQLIAGQGTLGLEIVQDWPEVDVVVVPIGGGGLISGVSMAVKSHNPRARVIGVESSDGPAMKRSIEAGRLETIDCRTIIDGLRVRRVGEATFSVVQRFVDDIVTLPDRDIFDAMIWVMERCKLVVEGAAAAPVAALLHGLVKLPEGSRVAAACPGTDRRGFWYSRCCAPTLLGPAMHARGAAGSMLPGDYCWLDDPRRYCFADGIARQEMAPDFFQPSLNNQVFG